MKLAYLFAVIFAAAPSAFAETRVAPPAPGHYDCALVQASALKDLPKFCEAEPFNKVRLVDFINQIDILEKQCGKKQEASRLTRALHAKVHKKDSAACRKAGKPSA